MKKVVIIGRTNVGKSTLFNVLTEQNKALVSKVPGTTRDRSYGTCSWQGQEFILIDTGGISKTKKLKSYNPQAELEKGIRGQVEIAFKEADLILFLADIRDGILPGDKEIASYLRKTLRQSSGQAKKPIILTLNKADSSRLRERAGEFFKLGLGEPIIISALTGSGTGDLLDRIIDNKGSVTHSKAKGDKAIANHESLTSNLQPPTSNLSIVGKTNVGKSSLLNAILGEERVIVSEIPHTTREPQDTLINYKNQPILLIDTAGIRKKAKIKSFLEKEGVRKSLRVLKDSDVVLFVVEAHQPITHQDKALAKYIVESKKGIVIVANKCDLITKHGNGSAFGPRYKSVFKHPLIPLRGGNDFTTTLKGGNNSLKGGNNSPLVKGVRGLSEILPSLYIHQSLPSLPWAPIIFISANPVRNSSGNQKFPLLKNNLSKVKNYSSKTDISNKAKTSLNVKKVLNLALEVKREREKEIGQKELDEFFQQYVKPKTASPWSSDQRVTKKIYSLKQTGTKPAQFTLSISKKTELSPAYLKFLEKRLREKFGFVGTPIGVEYRIIK